jgi:hypothetical protein
MFAHVVAAFALAALSWPVAASFAEAAKITPKQQAEAMNVAMHDAVFTLYHEAGHLLIDELKLPVLGKEEDAADALAIIQIFENTADKAELARTLNDVADDWYYSSLRATKEDMTAYDDHSLDIQRANAIVCMMVGAKPEEFMQKAEDYGLDENDQDNCVDDYDKTLASWTTVLAPHLASKPGPVIKVTYERADDGHLRRFAEALKSRRILEGVAERLRSTYALPSGLSIVAKECDDANSYYLEDEHQILYCYELASDIYQLAVDNRFGEGTTAADDTADQPSSDVSGSGTAQGLTSIIPPNHAGNAQGGR